MLIAGISNRGLFIVFMIMATPCHVLLYTIYFCYVLFLYRTFAAVKPHNRWLHPYAVWLLLVPGVHLVWYFCVVFLLAKSLASEFGERRSPLEHRRLDKGLAFAVLILNGSWLAVLLGFHVLQPDTSVFDVDSWIVFSGIVVAFNLLAIVVDLMFILAVREEL